MRVWAWSARTEEKGKRRKRKREWDREQKHARNASRIDSSASLHKMGEQRSFAFFCHVIASWPALTRSKNRIHSKEKVRIRDKGKKEEGDSFGDDYPPSLIENIRRGIPPSCRGAMWLLLSGADERKGKGRGEYARLLRCEPDSKATRHIQQDLTRTFPKHPMFRNSGGLGQQELSRVLRAFSVYCPRVSYCQGMGFIVALLLCHMGEEDAFWTLVALMENPKYDLAHVFINGLPKLMRDLDSFSIMVGHFLPKLATHLEQETQLNPSIFTKEPLRWFMTVFSSCSDHLLPRKVVSRIWDIFLAEGWSIVFKVSLVIMTRWESDLLALDYENILQYTGRGRWDGRRRGIERQKGVGALRNGRSTGKREQKRGVDGGSGDIGVGASTVCAVVRYILDGELTHGQQCSTESSSCTDEHQLGNDVVDEAIALRIPAVYMEINLKERDTKR